MLLRHKVANIKWQTFSSLILNNDGLLFLALGLGYKKINCSFPGSSAFCNLL